MTTLVPTQCPACARLRDGVSCDAFPDGIPESIAVWGADHTKPIKGDHGLQFQMKDSDAAQEAFEDWQRAFGS